MRLGRFLEIHLAITIFSFRKLMATKNNIKDELPFPLELFENYNEREEYSFILNHINQLDIPMGNEFNEDTHDIS